MIAKAGVYGLLLALAACLVLAVLLWWQADALDHLESENERLTRNAGVLLSQVEQARQSAAEAAAYAQRERDLNMKASATIEAIRNLELGECADAPLDPSLADILGRGLRTED